MSSLEPICLLQQLVRPRTPCDSRGDSAWRPVWLSGLPLVSARVSVAPWSEGQLVAWPCVPSAAPSSLFCLLMVLSLQHLWVPTGSM